MVVDIDDRVRVTWYSGYQQVYRSRLGRRARGHDRAAAAREGTGKVPTSTGWNKVGGSLAGVADLLAAAGQYSSAFLARGRTLQYAASPFHSFICLIITDQ